MPTYYVTRADLKTRLDIPSADTGSDAMLDAMIEAVSNQINHFCGRVFWTASAEVRYFDAQFEDYVEIDDLVSLSALATDLNQDRAYSIAWASTDYELSPVNAAAASRPYTLIWMHPTGRYAFPAGRKTVKITGTWGWPAVPKMIAEATFLQCARLYQRRNSPMGVAGPNEFGQLTPLAPIDPDVKTLLWPFVRAIL